MKSSFGVRVGEKPREEGLNSFATRGVRNYDLTIYHILGRKP